MQTRLLWRRSATALGLYGGSLWGFSRAFWPRASSARTSSGRLTLAIFAAGFVQLALRPDGRGGDDQVRLPVLDRQKWGRLRTLYRRAMVLKTSGLCSQRSRCVLLAPFADSIFNTDGLESRSCSPPCFRSRTVPESPAGAALMLAGRYDIRAGTTSSPSSCGRRAHRRGAVRGDRGGARARARPDRRVDRCQLGGDHASSAGSLRRSSKPLGEDRKEIIRFVITSSIGSGIVSLRGAMCRSCSASYRPERGRVLPGRAVPADGPHRADLAGAADPDHGADARLGARRLRQRVRQPAAVQLWALVLMVARVPIFYWVMPTLIRMVFETGYAPATERPRA